MHNWYSFQTIHWFLWNEDYEQAQNAIKLFGLSLRDNCIIERLLLSICSSSIKVWDNKPISSLIVCHNVNLNIISIFSTGCVYFRRTYKKYCVWKSHFWNNIIFSAFFRHHIIIREDDLRHFFWQLHFLMIPLKHFLLLKIIWHLNIR